MNENGCTDAFGEYFILFVFAVNFDVKIFAEIENW